MKLLSSARNSRKFKPIEGVGDGLRDYYGAARRESLGMLVPSRCGGCGYSAESGGPAATIS